MKRKQPSLSRYLLLDKQVIILTAILALKRGHWIFWFLVVEGEVWIHVCLVVVEQPPQSSSGCYSHRVCSWVEVGVVCSAG